MKKHNIFFSIVLLFCCIFFISCNYITNDNKKTNTSIKDSKQLKIHFIDVGQGDSTLIEINGYTLLIDAGPEASSKKLKNYLDKNGITKLDYVVATHPHEDHIGGMPEIIKNYKIDHFLGPKVTNNTDIFKNMVKELKSKSLKIQVLKKGDSLNLGENVEFNILAPIEDNYEDDNNYSVVAKLSYKDTSFLFMGDAETLVESQLLRDKTDVKADVLKVGHHGSTSSSSKAFLKAVSPQYAVIFCGKNNKFGHPHKETIEKLQQADIKYFRTDKDGNIVITSDGKYIKKDQVN